MCWRTYEITLLSGQIAYCWSRKLKYLRNHLSHSYTCFTCHVLSHYYTVYKSDEIKKSSCSNKLQHSLTNCKECLLLRWDFNQKDLKLSTGSFTCVHLVSIMEMHVVRIWLIFKSETLSLHLHILLLPSWKSFYYIGCSYFK